MKLSIRVKFFIVLLAFSLGPVFLSRLIVGRTAVEMATNLFDGTRTELLEIVSAELEHNAMSLLANLEARGEGLSLAARMLAQQAGHYLGREDHEKARPNLYASDFHLQGKMAPPPGRTYVRKGMMGRTQTLAVSLDSPTVRLAPGTFGSEAPEQLQKLQSLLPTFKTIYGELEEAPYWFNIGLESGAFMAYPGHGDIPGIYDHRSQGWYARARDGGGDCVWTMPVLDPFTRGAVATVACPILGKGDKFIGTASIDVPISDVLGDAELKSRWSGEILSFMVSRPEKGADVSKGLLILAQQSYGAKGHRHWKSGIELEHLISNDPSAFEQLLAAMKKNKSGFMLLPYKGKSYVWSYASNANLSFLLLAPENVVARLPDQVSGTLTSLFNQMRSLSAVIAGVMFIVTGLIAWFGSRAIIRPLLAMVEAVKRLAAGDFSVHIDYHTNDEREALIKAFNEMGPKLREHMLIRRDLELAQEVQNLLLPRTSPNLSGFDISGGIVFCDQTGGDYYDFIDVPDGEGRALDVVLGDVSGHGVPSALVMATARGQLHTLSKVAMPPEDRIRVVNSVLSRDLNGTGRFLTLFYLRLVADSDEVRWVRAGHDPAMRYDPVSDQYGELGGTGLPLGVLEEAEYASYTARIGPGEVLVLATDGVWEARNGAGEMFGKQRMLAIIGESAHKSAHDIKRAIMDAVEVFQENGQNDDIAVVVVKRLQG